MEPSDVLCAWLRDDIFSAHLRIAQHHELFVIFLEGSALESLLEVLREQRVVGGEAVSCLVLIPVLVAAYRLKVGQALRKSMLVLSKVVWYLIRCDLLSVDGSIAAGETADH